MEKEQFDRLLLIRVVIGYLLVVVGVAIRPIMYIAAAYYLITIVLSKKTENIVCMLFAWLSISTIFKFSVGGTSIFTYIELIAIIKFMVIDRKVGKRFLLLWMVYLIYLIVGMDTAYTDLIKTAIIPLLLFFMAKSLDYYKLKIVSFYYIIGVIINSFLGYFKGHIPNMQQYVVYKTQGVGYAASVLIREDRFSGLWVDPNYYSVHLILVIAICAVLFSRKEIKPIIFYSCFVLMTIFGAMTGSKSFVAMLMVVTVLSLFLFLKNRVYQHALFFSFIIIVGIVLLTSGYMDLFSKVVYRLQNVSSSGITTGRTDIWKSYFNLWIEKPYLFLFGSGLGNGFLLRVPHNTFMDFIALLGVFGTGIFCSVMFFSLSEGFWDKKHGVALPLLTLGMLYFFLSVFQSIEFVFQVLLVFGFFFLIPEENNVVTGDYL